MLVVFVRRLKYRFSVPFFVLLLLSGCSQSTSPQYPLRTPIPLRTASVTLTPPAPQPSSPGIGVSFHLGKGIDIESAGGFVCHFSRQGSPTPGTLVLPSVRGTFDEGTLQSLKNYLNAVGAAYLGGRPDTAPYAPFPADATAFQLVAANTADIGCTEVLQLTNNGSADVQISQVSLQFIQDTHVNTRYYNLVDACSLSLNFLSFRCPPALGAQEPGYVAQFNLHTGKAHAIMPATCWGYDDLTGCSPQKLTLHSGDFAKITLSYFSTVQSNLSFAIQPLFTLDGPGQPTISYPAPQLRVTFAFASLAQFSCYALQGQQFVETSLDEDHWCL